MVNPVEIPTTVVVDTSVFIHQLHSHHNVFAHTDKHWAGLIGAQLEYLMSGHWLGDLKPDKFQVVFVCDQKDSNLKYWRHEYLTRPEVVASVPRKTKALERKRLRLQELLEALDKLRVNCDYEGVIDISLSSEFLKLTEDLAIAYKAGRKHPEYSFTKLKKITYNLIRERKWNIFMQTGYEADDIAAAFVQINKTLEVPNRIVLLTIDSDWMGLIDDHTSWFCMHGWFPRIRSDFHSVNTWAEKRLGSSLESFRDIWDIKGQQGDKSDNLPASNGALLPVIDLLNPPDEHKLWLQPIGEAIKDTLVSPKYRTVPHQSALQYVEALGVNLGVRPLDPLKDFA